MPVSSYVMILLNKFYFIHGCKVLKKNLKSIPINILENIKLEMVLNNILKFQKEVIILQYYFKSLVEILSQTKL